MLGVKFGVNIEPSFLGTVLMVLEIGHQVVSDCRELILEGGVKCDPFSSDSQAGTTFGGIECANGKVNHSSGQQSFEVFN